MVVRILLRRDTTANWNSVNPILGDGELGIERLPDNSIKLKFGDGTTPWSQLGYNPVYVAQFEDHKQDSNAHGLDTIKNDITDLQNDFNNINTTISNVDLTGIQEDVDTIKSEIVDIQTDIEDINSKLETIDVVSIRGSIDTFADLQDIDPSTLLEGSAYIVEQDETRGDITTVYAVIDNNGTKEWEFIAEFKVDLSNFYTKDEIDSKISIINTNVQAITNAAIRNDVNNLQVVPRLNVTDYFTAQNTDFDNLNVNIIGTDSSQIIIEDDLDLNGHSIKNVCPPQSALDATNKQYVDSKASTNWYKTGINIGNAYFTPDNPGGFITVNLSNISVRTGAFSNAQTAGKILIMGNFGSNIVFHCEITNNDIDDGLFYGNLAVCTYGTRNGGILTTYTAMIENSLTWSGPTSASVKIPINSGLQVPNVSTGNWTALQLN